MPAGSFPLGDNSVIFSTIVLDGPVVADPKDSVDCPSRRGDNSTQIKRLIIINRYEATTDRIFGLLSYEVTSTINYVCSVLYNSVEYRNRIYPSVNSPMRLSGA
jgi:hypothetical protein